MYINLREIQDFSRKCPSHDDGSAPILPNHENSKLNYKPACDFKNFNSYKFATIGEIIFVFWPLNHQYVLGAVDSIEDDGKHVIHYDDDVELLDLRCKILKYDNHNALSFDPGFVQALENNEQEVITLMFDVLGDCSSLAHHAQVFNQAPMVKTRLDEENKL